MSQQYIDHKDVTNLEELLDAVDTLRENSDDHHASTVYVRLNKGDNGIRLSLYEETLSDGSTVKNIWISPLH